MAVKVLIPSALSRYAENQEQIEVSGGTVRDALRTLVELHPDLRKHLYGDGDELRQYVNVYLGEEDIRRLQGPETPVRAGQEITIVPSIAGGVGVAEPPQKAQDVTFSNEEILRYSRHLIMPEVALDGQKKLKAAKVLCI